MRPRRHVRRPPDLTSLFDVLFIVVFAALIRAAAVQNAAAHPPAPAAPPAAAPRAPATPPDVAALRARALADLQAELSGLTPVVVRITRDGAIEALEVGSRRIALIAPLIEHSQDPSVVITYAGDHAADRQVCRTVAKYLGATELSRYLVIMVPAVTLDDLPQALFVGLHSDAERCRFEQRTAAVIVDPTTLPALPAAPPTTPPRGTP